ncbi:hypothetical protein AGOR_G00056810 [Albula goreensis]|uniref:Uncharacterized protein n=1 Tax=Albula goreensis TaxID=1534307 RepID=A0A8T3DUL8_9TELE|nr:hypothetical protein AGOR_G00056810 [Albula goreensis]
MSTGVNSDTAKACGTVFTTTTPSVQLQPASNGRTTTTPAVSGREAPAVRLRSLCNRVRKRGLQNRPSSLPFGTSDRNPLQTGTCPSPRISPKNPDSLVIPICLPTGFLLYMYTVFCSFHEMYLQPKWSMKLS